MMLHQAAPGLAVDDEALRRAELGLLTRHRTVCIDIVMEMYGGPRVFWPTASNTLT